MNNPSRLVRFPFAAGDGITRYCVAAAMTDEALADEEWSVDAPTGKSAPTYCVDCLGELGNAELLYGANAQKCMRCGSVFLKN